jgi:hypothetical protein
MAEEKKKGNRKRKREIRGLRNPKIFIKGRKNDWKEQNRGNQKKRSRGREKQTGKKKE